MGRSNTEDSSYEGKFSEDRQRHQPIYFQCSTDREIFCVKFVMKVFDTVIFFNINPFVGGTLPTAQIRATMATEFDLVEWVSKDRAGGFQIILRRGEPSRLLTEGVKTKSIGPSTCGLKCRTHQVASKCTWTEDLSNGPTASSRPDIIPVKLTAFP